jgi:hypothetical protein
MNVYRVVGTILVISGIAGYFTVADELHHLGEFIGVSTVLLAGIVFLTAGSKAKVASRFAIQWIAYGLLAGIPFGGIVLDNMLIGVGIGLCTGTALAFLLGKRQSANGS